MKELPVALALIGILFSLLIPLPSQAIDFLLVANLVFALIIFISALYIPDPLKFSALPSILLLLTVFRLVLNISTTRMILGSGSAGQLLEIFGKLVIQGDLIVGAVIFLVITLVQFIVIAKGSERVAEVAARFTLDALPGKQMSIDADLRSGLIDVFTAKKNREKLQTESRFYGALDGTMKFIKGDAIAGIVITLINVVGGLIIGVLLKGNDLGTALRVYTLLTIGDGLLSQIPALLNSISAGMVVTRVTSEQESSLASDIIQQLGQIPSAKIIIALISLILGFTIGPPIAFLSVSILLFLSLAWSENKEVSQVLQGQEENFVPSLPALIQLHCSKNLEETFVANRVLELSFARFQKYLFENFGLIIPTPVAEFTLKEESTIEIFLRGSQLTGLTLSSDVSQQQEEVYTFLVEKFSKLAPELLDDQVTRRLLDYLDQISPEFVANIIPEVVTVTQVTAILRNLLDEGISIRNLDLVLQAIAEQGPKIQDLRALYEEVRIKLNRQISSKFSSRQKIKALKIGPEIDFAFINMERKGEPLPEKVLERISQLVSNRDLSSETIVCSRGARRLLSETLRLYQQAPGVIAYEEILPEYQLEITDLVDLEPDLRELDLINAAA